jgi:predicted esterase
MLKLNNTIPPHGGERILYAGETPEKAASAMIMIHGRGATAESMLSLADALSVDNMCYIVPQASGFAWYPHRFIERRELNEPGASSAIRLIGSIVEALSEQHVAKEHIYLLGFSQGACLVADYAARYPERYGGIFILSGGLIGEHINGADYAGNLDQTPVFLGCSDSDFHIPEERVHKSAEIFTGLNARVTKRIYPAMEHTVNEDEIWFVRDVLSRNVHQK